MNCADFFRGLDSLEDASNRGNRLRAVDHPTLVSWQQMSASEYSPSPVADQEDLRLSLYEGRQIDDGQISRKTFSPLVDLGLSVDRCSCASISESHSRAVKKASMDGRPCSGYLEISVAFLRAMRYPDDGRQAIGVFDTSVPPTAEDPGNISHAEAFMLFKRTNSVPIKSLQTDLLDQYKNAVKRWPD